MSNPVNVIKKDQKISNKITSEYPPVPEGKNVLYLVGCESDFNLMCTLWDTFETEEFNVFVYGTDLRRIVDETFPEGKYNPNVDLLEQLRKTEFLPHKRYHIEQKKYDYIYMIFDFDPSIEQDRLMMVMDHFDDATDKGKLYLNYPTADSFRHVVSGNDEEFMDRTAGEVGSRYKNVVDRSCLPKLRVIDRCGTEILKELIQMHLKKANYILNGDYVLPKAEELKKLKSTEILEAQYLAKELYDEVYVLNTSVFNIAEMYPEKFLE